MSFKAIAVTALITLSCICINPKAMGEVRYTVTDLGLGRSIAYGINNHGQVVGQNLNNQHAFLYDNGTTLDLGSGQADHVNDKGQVTLDLTVGGTLRACLYDHGTITELGTLGGRSSVAIGINSNAHVTGWANTSAGQTHAFVYSNGNMTDLGTLGGTSSMGYGINDNGQIAGYATLNQRGYHAFLYSNGTMSDLGTLGGENSEAWAINQLGQVTGYSDAVHGSHAFLYSNGLMTDLGTLGGGTSQGRGINDKGQVTGMSYLSPDLIHAFLYSDGIMTDLNTLIDASSGWTLRYGQDINNLGQICGYGTNPSGQDVAFLLTPVPEPCTLVLLGLGGLLLRRKKN